MLQEIGSPADGSRHTRRPQQSPPRRARRERKVIEMELVGLRGRLAPDGVAPYAAAHDAIPEQVISAQRAAGIRRWVIFRDGLDLFHFAECEDFARAAAALARDPFDQRWQDEVRQYKAPVSVTGDTESRMELIYSRQIWIPGQNQD